MGALCWVLPQEEEAEALAGAGLLDETSCCLSRSDGHVLMVKSHSGALKQRRFWSRRCFDPSFVPTSDL